MSNAATVRLARLPQHLRTIPECNWGALVNDELLLDESGFGRRYASEGLAMMAARRFVKERYGWI